MGSDSRLKKLRGSGGYVMARVTDEQQSKGNLGGPDLFLAPVGRLPESDITRYFCNTCEKESEGAPGIEFESPGEVVAENLVLAEKGKYLCSCGSTIAEYRQFSKQDEGVGVGAARPAAPEPEQAQAPAQIQQAPEQAAAPGDAGAVVSIEGRDVIGEDANRAGTARRVGIDGSQSMVLVIARPDGTEYSVPWSGVKKVGEVILLGGNDACACGHSNKPGSKFCEECGSGI